MRRARCGRFAVRSSGRRLERPGQVHVARGARRLLGPAPRACRDSCPARPERVDSPAGSPAQPSQLLELVLGVFERSGSVDPSSSSSRICTADRSTLELVAFLVRSLRASAALIGTYRSDEIHRRHALRPLLAGWDRVRTVRRVELARSSVAMCETSWRPYWVRHPKEPCSTRSTSVRMATPSWWRSWRGCCWTADRWRTCRPPC